MKKGLLHPPCRTVSAGFHRQTRCLRTHRRRWIRISCSVFRRNNVQDLYRRCTPHSTFLIERTKKHIILPFPPAFICFRKTWIPHFRRCSRMRMQCFTRRNRNEIRMLRKFYQNRNWFFSGKQLEYLRDDFWIPYFKRNRPAKTAVWSKISKKGRWTEWIVVILMGEVPA